VDVGTRATIRWLGERGVRVTIAAEGGVCTLLIQVSPQVAGMERLAQVTLRRGAESAIDVRSPAATAEVSFVASPRWSAFAPWRLA
jgi:hypothetical protein